jgi:RNA ligase (TIGR02306 family)
METYLKGRNKMADENGSTFKVPVTAIKEIFPHPDKDTTSLEYAKVYDFNVIVRKNEYKVGDRVVYVPIDSILPFSLESKIFGPDSKIKLNKSRVKQIKIRGYYSQGMLINFDDLDDLHPDDLFDENDLSEKLGITKYEPPKANYQEGLIKKRDKPLENPYFHKYGGIDNFKWYPDLFEAGEMVSVTEKIHGSNIRAGYVPFVANTLWKKILKFFKKNPSHEWVYGSNNVQLQKRSNYKGFYGSDVYGKVLEKYGVREKLKPGEVIYGEIYGDGIQANYNYGCKQGEHKLVVFDLKIQTQETSDFVGVEEFQQFCVERGFPTPPELYRGPFDKEKVKVFTQGASVLCPEQKVREGVVVKPVVETKSLIGRKVLKIISEKYLEKDQTDFH